MPTEEELLNLQIGNHPLIQEETKSSEEKIEETHQIIKFFF